MFDASKLNRSMMLALQSISFTGSITIEYSGSGDSGQIDDITVKDALINQDWLEKHDAPKEIVDYFKCKPSWWEVIDNWAVAITDGLGYDWYNNDGGGGTITIEPQSGLIEIDAYYNELTRHSVAPDFEAIEEDDPAFTHDYYAASVSQGVAPAPFETPSVENQVVAYKIISGE